MSYILGLNIFHADSSACILRDGVMLAAVEEERFTRIKHWSGLPLKSIEYCLDHAKITFEDIDEIAINHSSKKNLLKKIIYTLKHPAIWPNIVNLLAHKSKKINFIEALLGHFPNQKFLGKVSWVEHHHAHMSSAYYPSPFDRAVCVSVDGFGDFSSAAWGLASNNSIANVETISFPHSLGIFYQALTQYLGFPNYGDEYKVMGLAAYGEPIYLDAMKKIVLLSSDGRYELNLKYFKHQWLNLEGGFSDGVPFVGILFSSELENLLGKRRELHEPITKFHKDIAASVQKMYELGLFNLLNSVYPKFGCQDLVLAGGCSMNSVANGKIMESTNFRNVYIQSSPGDAGGAIGAALHVWYSSKKYFNVTRDRHNHAYWGPDFSNDAIKKILDFQYKQTPNFNLTYMDEDSLYKNVAQAISSGLVIGWFQGRMEWGPRALGNRSILGDPRRSDMKEILNSKIKRRESFRPFAPSILREAVSEWFENDLDVPFMMQVLNIKKDKRKLIPAVTHVDGSGRLQTVHFDANPKYHKLISAFRDLTGVPIILNTSFNENEPVVCSPEEAINCFLRTGMDMLVLGNWVLNRR